MINDLENQLCMQLERFLDSNEQRRFSAGLKEVPKATFKASTSLCQYLLSPLFRNKYIKSLSKFPE